MSEIEQLAPARIERAAAVEQLGAVVRGLDLVLRRMGQRAVDIGAPLFAQDLIENRAEAGAPAVGHVPPVRTPAGRVRP